MSKALWTLCFAVLFALGFSAARADEWNKQTTVTFSGPVEIPGKVLPAGTYQFKLLDSQSNRNIVQIFNADGTQLYATILAIPDYRQNPTSETVMKFEERPAGTPEALRAWFYPGDNYGNEFVYPRSEAAQIARRTHQNVLSMGDEMKNNITTPAKTANEPSVRALSNTKVTATTPNGNQVDMNQAVQSKKQ
ncbi:MAG TPA: hypothetical protein VKX39_08890 [Bryobacteraceae bacterium]|jgi:hypothetical protein|nr:hypothetical protein [Bryobacteraceae bacterium]